MPTTLTATDLATMPTGVSATISGSSGANNTIYGQWVNGQSGNEGWNAVATQSGDGTLTVLLAPGFWWLYCLSAPTTLSPIVYTQVTTGELSVLDRCILSISTTLGLLNLKPSTPGNPSPSAYILDALNEKDPKMGRPGIMLTTDKANPSNEGALNGRDDLGHAIRVSSHGCVLALRFATAFDLSGLVAERVSYLSQSAFVRCP